MTRNWHYYAYYCLFLKNCNYSWCPEPRGCFRDRIEYSMYILGPDNPVRRLTFHIIAQKWFDNSVLLFIALNCITLAMERPGIPAKSSVCNSIIFLRGKRKVILYHYYYLFIVIVKLGSDVFSSKSCTESMYQQYCTKSIILECQTFLPSLMHFYVLG